MVVFSGELVAAAAVVMVVSTAAIYHWDEIQGAAPLVGI
jgi:hypothetical protein